jgi:hypothetical protein
MPLPLIPIAIAISAGAASLFGIGKGINGIQKSNKTKEVNKRAKSIVDEANNRFDRSREQCNSTLQSYGVKKLEILKNDIGPFAKLLRKLHNVRISDLAVGHDMISEKEILELEQRSMQATDILKAAGGVLGGAITAFGAYSATVALGTAGTGTAIATLHGVAATNATLAFLGGGSLAAGGLGVSGGIAILGGLVAAPALLITGIIIDAKAEKYLNEAHANLAKAEKHKAEVDAGVLMSDSIQKQCQIFIAYLDELAFLFRPLVSSMRNIIEAGKTDFQKLEKHEKDIVMKSVSIAQVISKLMNTSILTKEGGLSDESNQCRAEIKEFLAHTQTRTDGN